MSPPCSVHARRPSPPHTFAPIPSLPRIYWVYCRRRPADPDCQPTRGARRWALGIVLHELLAGYPPFFDETPLAVYEKIRIGTYECPRHFSPQSADLVRRLLTADPSKRLGCLKHGAEDIKKHKWFRGLNWVALYNKQLEPVVRPQGGLLGESNFGKFPESVEESGPLLLRDKDKELFGGF